tara:strand:+ start:123 stop:641 length:519 start_codon:yes stop_codon:yes gene_type:complete
MIQGTTETNFDAYLNTAANQIVWDAETPGALFPIPQPHPNGSILYLCKFINDMSGKVIYTYPDQYVYPRYSAFDYTYSPTPDMYAGEVNIELAGYWKYEFWEVHWSDTTPTVIPGSAPSNETDILPVAPENGVVKGLVAIGKMYVAERKDKREVTYNEYIAPIKTNYIYHGQ